MSSPPSVSKADNDKSCIVCGAEAHGIHFQVNSCRACAAFFRRSADYWKRYKCRRASYNCDVSKDALSQCRRCRYQRCKQVGMTLDGVKQRKAPPSQAKTSAEHQKATEKEASDQTRHSVDLQSAHIKEHRHKCETHSVKYEIERILSQDAPSTSKTLTIESMIDAFNSSIQGGKPENVEIMKKLNFRDYLGYFHEELQRIAKWMMRCGEFANLPTKDKWRMYCRFWTIYHSIERCARTTEFLGADCPSTVLLKTDTVAVDLTNYEYETGMEENASRKAHEHFKSANMGFLDVFIIPMRTLDLTTQEIVFLCLYKMWSIERIKNLSSKTYLVAEHVLEKIGDEMHEFYVRKLKMVNYSLRLANVMKLLTELEGQTRLQRHVEITADVFNIFGCDFKESEFYGEEGE